MSARTRDMRPVAATEDELRNQCDHVCLKDLHHVERGEPHFYGYRGGPWSLYGMQGQIEELRAEVERLRGLLSRVPVVEPCETNPGPPRCGFCEACRDLKQLDREVEAWDREGIPVREASDG